MSEVQNQGSSKATPPLEAEGGPSCSSGFWWLQLSLCLECFQHPHPCLDLPSSHPLSPLSPLLFFPLLFSLHRTLAGPA